MSYAQCIKCGGSRESIDRLTRENEDLRAKLEDAEKARDEQARHFDDYLKSLGTITLGINAELWDAPSAHGNDRLRWAVLIAQKLEELKTDRREQVEAGGCFFCRDCDAVRCEPAVLSPLRHIAEQAGKRNWWNVLHTIIELNKAAIQAMNRDINNPIAAAAVKEAGK